MIFDRNEKKQVVALLGAGSMGTAIVRRIAAGKKILLGDISEKALERVGDDFRRSGYDVETQVVNALERESIEAFAQRAASLGSVMYFIDTAGASPNQASPEHIVALDMVGTGYAVDAFGRVMAEGGAGLIISSQAAYMYPIPNEDELQIVNASTDELAALPIVRDVAMQNSGLVYGEFNANGAGYQAMIDASAARRVASSDEIADAAAFLLGEHATFINGTDLLIDGGVIASLRTGMFKLQG